jgi:hypothetical protein
MFLYGLALVVVALNAIDLLQTKRLFRDYEPESEANFMIRAIYRRWGFRAVIFFKAVLIGVAVCIALISQSVWLMAALAALHVLAVFHNWSVMRDDTGSE